MGDAAGSIDHLTRKWAMAFVTISILVPYYRTRKKVPNKSSGDPGFERIGRTHILWWRSQMSSKDFCSGLGSGPELIALARKGQQKEVGFAIDGCEIAYFTSYSRSCSGERFALCLRCSFDEQGLGDVWYTE